MKRIVVVFFSLFLLSGVWAQDLRHYEVPPNDSVNHSSVISYQLSVIKNSDSVANGSNRTFKHWLGDKFFRENFLYVDKPGYNLTFDPLFDNYLGKDLVSDNNIYGNTRGLRVQGIISKLEFTSTYYESQSEFSPYLDSIISTTRMTPGQIHYRGSRAAIDHSYAVGKLRYIPSKMFSFEAGHGKNFFGNGYRSVLLSDAAANYPYFRIDTKIWKIHYVNLWAEFQDNSDWEEYGQPFQKKYGAFHYLSFAATKRLELSFFEVINWQGRDSTHTRGFEINYLNPVIMLRPVEWTIGSPDNVIMGFGFSYLFGKSTYLYGQFALDELSITEIRKGNFGDADNKVGWQLGVKSWVPLQGDDGQFLFFQSELNAVRPYTYSHISSKSNYGHLNQSLAHPLGANFLEWVNFVRLRWDRVSVEGRYSWAKFGSDIDSSNFGHNIYLPYTVREADRDVYIGSGVPNTLCYASLTASYLVNPASNFNLFFSLTDRKQNTDGYKKHDLIFQIGLRSSVRNLYYDY